MKIVAEVSDNGNNVFITYRLVKEGQEVGDVVLCRYFPMQINTRDIIKRDKSRLEKEYDL